MTAAAAGYTPGLTVAANALVRRTRRLPLKGTVLVAEGDAVTPETIVARADLPGPMQTIKVAGALGIEPTDVARALTVKVGDTVAAGQIVARTRGLMGLFKSECRSSYTGMVEIVSPISGNVGVRIAPTPVEIRAYIPGRVAHVLPGEGVVVETHGAFIQGIFGVGGERRGRLRRAAAAPSAPLTENNITSDLAGCVVVGGSIVEGAALRRAAEVGVAGIVVGGIVDQDLVAFLGYDIGVAITGQENIALTLVLTEGFGAIPMAERTWALLGSLENREASLSGATQIRAGVIRPEIIVPAPPGASSFGPLIESAFTLTLGAHVRLIREPYFGRLAVVSALPPRPARIGSGAIVRVLEASLKDTGETVTVPRANVEVVAG